MLRTRLNEALKEAMKAKNQRALSTVRLILAALKDRDIAARTRGAGDAISDEEILQLLQTMVKQRREAIVLYQQGGRQELAQQEAEEIAVIESFLPKQLGPDEVQAAVSAVIAEVGASGIKDMGRVMASLRERYAGQMDFSKASGMVKERLGSAG